MIDDPSMHLKPHSIVSFLVLLLLFHVAAAGGDGDQFRYDGFAGAALDLDGMAVVEPDGKLMLTNVTSQMKGHAFHPAPLRFHHPPPANGTAAAARSFSTAFVFAIAADYVTVSGNGLAFFVAPSKNMSTASPSQFLGLFNSENNGNASNRVFAVELDTILNPEFRDINSNHVGVDVNGLVSVAAEPAGYYDDATGGAFKNLTLFSGAAMKVWVDYDGRAAVVNVTLAPVEVAKPRRPLISVAVDLSPVVNGTAYVGLSSSTGPFHTRHYEAALVLKLGLLCSHPVAAARPTMRQVVHFLDGDAPLPEPEPTYRSFTTLAMMQNADGFDSCAVSYPSTATSIDGASSVLSGGRERAFFAMVSLPCLVVLLLAAAVGGGGGGGVEFVYDGFGGAALALDGMATVTPGGLLLLTNDTDMNKGHAFHPDPVRFVGGGGGGGGGVVASFSTTFVFAIVSEFLDLSTSGFAFLVAPSRDLSAAMPQQYLGMFNASGNGDARNRIFAVEFDTVRNPEFADINNNHVGVDVNSLNSSAAATAGYYDDATAAFQNLSLISRQPMQVWVDYDAAAAEVTVAMAPARRPRPKKPLLSTAVNLSTVVADAAYVGFSSASSIVLCKHYVLSWSFRLGGGGAAPALDYAKLPKLPRIGPKPRSKALTVALPIVTTAIVLTAVAVGFLLLRQRLRYAELREDWEVEFGPHRFSFKDLYDATGGFKDKRLLGAGGFGRVYKGVLPRSRTEVAVKRVSHESRQGMREFIAEVVSIGRIRHRNLVQLLGYCRRKGELLLVYDYMPNGSLDKYLHGCDEKPILDWAQRIYIIKGVASGLLYMHEDWEQVVIHRDIKASNVLLDSEMNGRLGDFGLARLYDHGADPQTTHVVGTMGYLAPEMVRSGKATTRSDVFAFGAFLLEVTCGRRPIEEEEEVAGAGADDDDRFVLVDWVLGHWREGAITDAVDAKLGGEYDAAEAELVLRLGLTCLHPSPAARPSMRQVMQYLDGSAPLPELPPTYVTFNMLAAMDTHQNVFGAWSVRRSSAMSVATVSDIGLSGGR
uniref:non-specific serine/threonine protein kinase n=1 Tax=Oryza barthii TaxID=65489 RepID=A0A0D3HE41_9ORYZ